eukprot:jgi/Tetstr1/426530/TSEL_016828.t1
MKVIAKKFRGVWHYGVITGVVTEWVLEDYGGATQWRAVFEDGDIVDLLRSEVVEAMAAAQEHPPVDADGEARLVTVHQGDDLSRSGKVTVQSGWVMEDCLHHMETFSILNAGPLLEEARNVVTEEDGPERKAQVDALTREGRTRYPARRQGAAAGAARRQGAAAGAARRQGAAAGAVRRQDSGGRGSAAPRRGGRGSAAPRRGGRGSAAPRRGGRGSAAPRQRRPGQRGAKTAAAGAARRQDSGGRGSAAPRQRRPGQRGAKTAAAGAARRQDSGGRGSAAPRQRRPGQRGAKTAAAGAARRQDSGGRGSAAPRQRRPGQRGAKTAAAGAARRQDSAYSGIGGKGCITSCGRQPLKTMRSCRNNPSTGFWIPLIWLTAAGCGMQGRMTEVAVLVSPQSLHAAEAAQPHRH